MASLSGVISHGWSLHQYARRGSSNRSTRLLFRCISSVGLRVTCRTNCSRSTDNSSSESPSRKVNRTQSSIRLNNRKRSIRALAASAAPSTSPARATCTVKPPFTASRARLLMNPAARGSLAYILRQSSTTDRRSFSTLNPAYTACATRRPAGCVSSLVVGGVAPRCRPIHRLIWSTNPIALPPSQKKPHGALPHAAQRLTVWAGCGPASVPTCHNSNTPPPPWQ